MDTKRLSKKSFWLLMLSMYSLALISQSATAQVQPTRSTLRSVDLKFTFSEFECSDEVGLGRPCIRGDAYTNDLDLIPENIVSIGVFEVNPVSSMPSSLWEVLSRGCFLVTNVGTHGYSVFFEVLCYNINQTLAGFPSPGMPGVFKVLYRDPS